MDKGFAEAMRRAGYTSNDSLARDLKAHAPEAFHGIEPRGLGAKIGDLGRGVTTWWRGRQDRIDALQALTGFDAGELVNVLVLRARGRWSFAEFTTLAPLDLLEELPAELGSGVPVDPKASDVQLDAWMQRVLPPSRRPPRLYALDGVVWLTVPPGCGRGLLLARLQAVAGIGVVVADTLDDAVSTAPGTQPVVLAPRRDVKPDDMVALTQLDPDRAVLVVTASACPLPTASSEVAWHPSWDWLATTASDRRKLDLVHGNQGGVYGFGGELRAFEWRLVRDWRLRLISWLEQRLAATGDTLFSRQGLNDWLQRFDPASVWFSTPADVVALASICHASGERKLPGPENAEAGARLLHRLAPMDSRIRSLLLRLVELRWRDATHEWLSPLPWDDWLEVVAAESREVADSEGGRVRKRRSPPLDLENLRQEGFLAADGRGWWAFAQPVQARLMLRDALMRWVSEGDLERWARPLTGDASRQATLDSVIVAMSSTALEGSVKAVLKAPQGSLVALGAAEALFVAFGRKFESGQAVYAPSLAGLLARILWQHDDVRGNAWGPFTRPEGENSGMPLSWLLACWEWSLCAPPPSALPPELANHFPGWMPDDDVDGFWYAQLPPSLLAAGEMRDEEREGFEDAVRSAQRVVDRVGSQGLVGFTEPGPLWAALMLVAAGRGHAEPKAPWWDILLRLRQAQHHLIRSLGSDDADAIATRLLPSFLAAAGGRDPLSPALAVLGPVWTWLFARSRPSKVMPGLPSEAVFALYRRFRGLPAAWRTTLEDRLGPDNPSWCWEAVLGESANPEALADRLLSLSPPDVALLPTLWRLAPERCLMYACDPQHQSSTLLIALCPTEQSGRLAAEIARRDDLLPDRAERLGWVLRRLRESRGQEASLRVLLDQLEIQ